MQHTANLTVLYREASTITNESKGRKSEEEMN